MLVKSFRKLSESLLPRRLQRFVRTALLERRRRSFERKVVQRRYGDACLSIELIDGKGQSWYDRDMEYEPEITLLRQHRLKVNATVFDIGAHQGVVALMLAQLVGTNGRVVAIEASPFDAAGAQRNQELNGCRQLVVRNAAIASKPGTIKFSTSGRVANNEAATLAVDVPACTIDELASEFGQPDVVFIDVDGFEVEALMGATHVLAHRPDLYLEVHPPYLKDYGQTAEDVLRILRQYGYSILASSVMTPSKRYFRALESLDLDLDCCFHVVAFHGIEENDGATA